MVLGKVGDQLAQSTEKWRSVKEVKVERKILQTVKRKANWIGHILSRNCLLKHVIEGKTQGQKEVKGRRGRRRKQLPDDLRKIVGIVY